MENSLDVVILSADAGAHLQSRRPKALYRILELPLLEYVLRAVSSLTPSQVILLGPENEEVRDVFAGCGVVFVDPVEIGKLGNVLRDVVRASRFLVVPGDLPLLSPESLQTLLREHRARGALLSLLTFVPECPGNLGVVMRDESGIPKAILGPEDVSQGGPAYREVSSGIWCAENLPEVREVLMKVPAFGVKCEDFLSTLYPRTWAVTWPNSEDLLRVNTRRELAQAEWILRQRIVARLQESGVTVVDPGSSFVGPEVTVGEDTVLYPGVYLFGKTEIGEECEIGPQTYLVDTVVERGVKVWFSVLEKAHVEEGARIGPYAHLRPGARIGRGARIGNFVEVKNAEIGEGVRAGHLAYIGDAEVGPDANIGAGTITCNYDGVRKHRTIIGKGAFIGSNAALVAPITIGEGAVVGAGSVITEDVPPYALALGRARQVIKPEWAKRRGKVG